MTDLAEVPVMAQLPPEPWGRAMKRAREDFAGMSMLEAVAAVAPFHRTTSASISRMEDAVDVPKDPRRRLLACVLAIAYGLDPNQFGVGLRDLPEHLRAAAVPAEQRERSTMWYRERAGHGHLRAVA